MSYLFLLIPLGVGMVSCSSAEKSENPSSTESLARSTAGGLSFQQYTIDDSSRIVTYEDGLQLYTVLEGPGDFPNDGMNVLVHYHGLLEDGTIFDSSYERGEPLKVRIGRGKLIQGFEYSLKQLRMGSKAIAIIPPSLGYGSKEDVPNVPPNSTLIFHIEVLGTF